MLHPLFAILIQRPELILEHVSGYGALIQLEASQAASALVKRFVAAALAIVCGLAFVLFSGVALMLGALHNQFHWMLIAVPGAALVVAVIAAANANSAPAKTQFTELKAQLSSDMQALKGAA